MRLKRFIGLGLLLIMTVSSCGIAFAGADDIAGEDLLSNDTEILTKEKYDAELLEEDREEIIPLASYDTTYPVEGGNIYFDSATGTITDCDTYVIAAVIPESINGVKVTSIGVYAFQDCNNLTSIEIPSSVTSIGKYAFEDCSSLTNIDIPNGITSIENSTFRGCSSLTGIEIPNSVMSIGVSQAKTKK